MSIEIQMPKDFTKIDVNELGEFIWWSHHLGIGLEQLLSIVSSVGPNCTDVREYIRSNNKPAKVQ